MNSELSDAIKTNQEAFGLELTDEQIGRISDFYDLVLEHNPLLHLVGPCTPVEFGTRHILESLTLLRQLPEKARIADVGVGGGLPSIPCLLVRDGLRVVLIESKEKKAAFLTEAVAKLGLGTRASVVCRQYAEVDPADCEIMTCRALDKFADKLPHLVRWSRRRKMLLFGGNNLADKLRSLKLHFDQQLMPMSEQRYLFTVTP